MNKKIKAPTFEEEKECERCGDKVPDDFNETPFGNMYCDDCISFDDVFPEDGEGFTDQHL